MNTPTEKAKGARKITWPEQPLSYESYEAWLAEGTRRFGKDPGAWRFVCPVCGYIAKVKDWRLLGAEEAAAFSCVGRWTKGATEAFSGKPGPCTYAGGGLFRLNPIKIEGLSGKVFAFAEAAS